MSDAYTIGAHHAAWLLAYAAGIATVLALAAVALVLGAIAARPVVRQLRPRLDILRNR